jgi:ABC-type nickel/cobalt efflux system permease component RcnA
MIWLKIISTSLFIFFSIFIIWRVFLREY